MVEIKGMLYDCESVYLFCALDETITNLVTCHWTTVGSLDIIRNFFSGPVETATVAFTCLLEVPILFFNSASLEVLERFGATGRVFRTTDGRALKISHGHHVLELSREFDHLIVSRYSYSTNRA
jgi:hypothetical protein